MRFILNVALIFIYCIVVFIGFGTAITGCAFNKDDYVKLFLLSIVATVVITIIAIIRTC